MTWDRIQAETEALQSLVQLYAQAKQCKQLYERAHMMPPEPLRRFLDIPPEEHKPAPIATKLTVEIPRPEHKRPGQATDEWVWVSVLDCRPTVLIPAIMENANEPLRAVDIVKLVVGALNGTVAPGSVYNAVARLKQQEVIEKNEDGVWQLLQPEMAGVIYQGFVWGPAKVFLKEELAAHRREAILHILSYFSAGLELVQIVEQLQNCRWMKAPANKDLLKADIQVLEADRKIKRRGHTRKWELVPTEKGENKTE